MTTVSSQKSSTATRIGHTLGRGVAALVRTERKAWSETSTAGSASVAVTVAKWVVRGLLLAAVAAVAVVGIAYLLLGLFAVVVIVGLASGKNSSTSSLLDDDVDLVGRKNGYSGYGVYANGVRVDQHDEE